MSAQQEEATAGAVEPTVSLTFQDPTGRKTLRIISAISAEDRVRVEADVTGEAVTRYVIGRVLHELRLQGVGVSPETPLTETPKAT